MQSSKRIKAIIDGLNYHYPRDDQPWQGGDDPFIVLISTILSAQTTDNQVDRVMPTLLENYPDANALSQANISDVEVIIKSVGLYKSKAKSIIQTGLMLMQDFKGQVPDTIPDLMTLSGVGQKTANVVLMKSFGLPALAVDTHVFRIATRLGIATSKTPLAVEKELCQIIPKSYWGAVHCYMIEFGRNICVARSPRCDHCRISNYCDYYQQNI